MHDLRQSETLVATVAEYLYLVAQLNHVGATTQRLDQSAAPPFPIIVRPPGKDITGLGYELGMVVTPIQRGKCIGNNCNIARSKLSSKPSRRIVNSEGISSG